MFPTFITNQKLSYIDYLYLSCIIPHMPYHTLQKTKFYLSTLDEFNKIKQHTDIYSMFFITKNDISKTNYGMKYISNNVYIA